MCELNRWLTIEGAILLHDANLEPRNKHQYFHDRTSRHWGSTIDESLC